MTNQWKRAKDTVVPKTQKQLSDAVDLQLVYQAKHLRPVLLRAMIKEVRGRDLRVEGPRKFGAENFRNIYYERKLPCLKSLIKLADRLNMEVTFKNFPFKHSLAVAERDWVFGKDFQHDQFSSFLNLLGTERPGDGDSPAMRKERAIILGKLSSPEFPIFWSTLIRYSAACGYQLNCYLDDKGREDYEALIRRLNYPM